MIAPRVPSWLIFIVGLLVLLAILRLLGAIG